MEEESPRILPRPKPYHHPTPKKLRPENMAGRHTITERTRYKRDKFHRSKSSVTQRQGREKRGNLRGRAVRRWERARKKKLAPCRKTTTPVHPRTNSSNISATFFSLFGRSQIRRRRSAAAKPRHRLGYGWGAFVVAVVL